MNQESFGDFDPDEFGAWAAAHPSWRDAGLAAAYHVASTRAVFTTCDVWDAWRGQLPPDLRAMAGIMDDAITEGWCRRTGVIAGHTRRAGHAGFGALYASLLVDVDARV